MHTSLTNYSYLKKNYLIEIINCLLYSELVRCIYDQLMNGEEHEHDAQQMAFSMQDQVDECWPLLKSHQKYKNIKKTKAQMC